MEGGNERGGGHSFATGIKKRIMTNKEGEREKKYIVQCFEWKNRKKK